MGRPITLSPGGRGAGVPATAMGPRIDLDGVAKWCQVGATIVTALSDVDLHADEAAFVVILGPSGWRRPGSSCGPASSPCCGFARRLSLSTPQRISCHTDLGSAPDRLATRRRTL